MSLSSSWSLSYTRKRKMKEFLNRAESIRSPSWNLLASTQRKKKERFLGNNTYHDRVTSSSGSPSLFRRFPLECHARLLQERLMRERKKKTIDLLEGLKKFYRWTHWLSWRWSLNLRRGTSPPPPHKPWKPGAAIWLRAFNICLK